MNKKNTKYLIQTLKTITENLNNLVNVESVTDGEYTYDGIMEHIKMIEVEEQVNE